MVFCVLLCVSPAYAAPVPYASDSVIVVYDDAGASARASKQIQAQAEAQLEEQGVQVEAVVEAAGDDLGTVVCADLPKGLSVEQAVSDLSDQKGIAFVQPNFIYHELAWPVNDPDSDDQYHLEMTGFDRAWQKITCDTGAPVTVAVLDSGCMVEHDDLKDVMEFDLAWSMVYNRRLKDLTTSQDTSKTSHGTHVCGIVGATTNNGIGVAGASYNARLLPICVLDTDGGSTDDLVRAYDLLAQYIDQGKVENLRVINLSLGYYADPSSLSEDVAMRIAIKRLRDEYGVLTVCAGGNGVRGYAQTDVMYPSDFDECLSITALDEKGKDTEYSDYNEYKDLSAPGEGFYSTYRKFDPDDPKKMLSRYKYMSGTSMASPVVAGAAALMWSANPNLTPDEVHFILRDTATPVEHDEARQGVTGSAGMLDAAAAVDRALKAGDLTSINGAQVTMEEAVTYDGSSQQPDPTVTLDGVELQRDRDYVVEYENNVDAGTATAVVVGTGSYCGSIRVPFAIKPIAITDEMVTLSATKFVYNEAYRVPAVTVCDAQGESLGWDDYYVDYPSSSTKVGTYYLTVKGVGNYAGTVKKSYVINPKGTYFTKLKAGKRSFQATVKKRTAQTTGYVVQYSTSSKFTTKKNKWLKSYKTVSATVTKLKAKKKYYVRVRTYKTVGSRTYYSNWSTPKTVKTL